MLHNVFNVQGKYFVVFIFICSVLFFSFVCGFTYFQLYSQRKAYVVQLNTSLSSQASKAMTLWLEDKIQLAQSFAQAPVIRDLCSNPTNREAYARAEKFLRQSHQRHLPHFTLLAVMYFPPQPNAPVNIRLDDGNSRQVQFGGSILDSIGGRSVGVGDASFSYVKAIAEGSNAFISEAKPNAVQGLPPLFMVAVPIYDNAGLLRGLFGFGVKLDVFSHQFVSNFQIGATGRIEIIDERGLYVGHNNADKVLNAAVEPETKSILPHLNMASPTTFSLMQGDQAHAYAASPVVLSYTSAHQWWVLFHRSEAESHGDLRFSLMALVGLALLGVFSMTALAHRIHTTAKKNAASFEEL